MTGSHTPAADVVVRGAATPDEVAAVVAALQLRTRAVAEDHRYERWRRERIAAIRPRLSAGDARRPAPAG